MTRQIAPVCGSNVGASWIDSGTTARTRHTPPNSISARPKQSRELIVVQPSTAARLLLAAQCGLPHMPSEMKQAIAPLLTYESMAVVAGSVAALVAAHALGVGFAIDIALGAVTIAVIGSDVIKAAAHLDRFYRLAMSANGIEGYEAAGEEFAKFVSIVGINAVLALLTRGRARAKATTVASGTARAGWLAYIGKIKFKVPRDKGILWTQIGHRHAERLAKGKGLVSLEMLLKEEGFYEVYAKQFGTFEEVKARGLDSLTAEIWKTISKKYAASLEGKVTAYVSQKNLSAKLSNPNQPVLVEELWDISEILEANSKILMVEMVDVSTGKTWLMLREQVLKASMSKAKGH